MKNLRCGFLVFGVIVAAISVFASAEDSTKRSVASVGSVATAPELEAVALV